MLWDKFRRRWIIEGTELPIGNGNGNDTKSQGVIGNDLPAYGNDIPIPNNQIAKLIIIIWD